MGSQAKTATGRQRLEREVPQPLGTFPLDQEIARRLAERVSEHNRLAFARSFAHHVIQTCWAARDAQRSLRPLPGDVQRTALNAEAENAAEQVGKAIARLDVEAIARVIGAVYTTALPAPYRASHGIFYTPPELVERLLTMAEDAGIDWKTARIIDPACGCAAFLLPVAKRMIASLEGTDPIFILQQIGSRLHGFEIDPFGAWVAQVAMDLALEPFARAASRTSPPIIVETRDSLDLRGEDEDKYDLVIGNPPYGRVSLAPERRKLFVRSIYGHANLYGVFTDAALRWAKPRGVVAYVTPTSMLSGLYFKALRTLLVDRAPPLAVNFVAEREGVFADVLQETMLATYRRDGVPCGVSVGFIEVGGTNGARLHRAGEFYVPSRPDAPWLLPRAAESTRLVRRLQAMPHRLKDYGYGVSTGPLVWNRHKTQFRNARVSGCHPVIWAESVTSDGRFLWRSEKRNHAPWFRTRRPKDNWLLVEQPCVLVQRTTAKEQPRRLIAAKLPDSFVRGHRAVVIENHLNMVRAISPDPVAPAEVIAALLNSAAVDAAFRCISGSVAVSAFELEELPLPSPPVISKLRALIASGATAKKIEAAIAAAYRMTDAAAAA